VDDDRQFAVGMPDVIAAAYHPHRVGDHLGKLAREPGETPGLTRSGMGDERADLHWAVAWEGVREGEPEPENLPAPLSTRKGTATAVSRHGPLNRGDTSWSRPLSLAFRASALTGS
jgi:hypothetical protein